MLKIKILVSIILCVVLFNTFIYLFDKIITPTMMAVSDAEMRAKCTEIVNQVMVEQYSKELNYKDIINVEKDKEGNIVMLSADTLKLNKIACQVSIIAQERLKALGDYGIRIPLGYIFKNSLLAYLGPSVKIKMQPIGSIETQYNSDFESAGINQTKEKIYVSFKTKMRIILPTRVSDLEVSNNIPIVETIIVGKIPSTAIQLDLQGAGYKLDNSINKK